MKAWYLEIRNDADQGAYVVFADTRNQARAQADSNDLFYDSWIDITARRARRYDEFVDKTAAELALQQWKDGCRWFDHDYPDPDIATDEEFLKWYEETF